jgi:hypothetical protein
MAIENGCNDPMPLEVRQQQHRQGKKDEQQQKTSLELFCMLVVSESRLIFRLRGANPAPQMTNGSVRMND